MIRAVAMTIATKMDRKLMGSFLCAPDYNEPAAERQFSRERVEPAPASRCTDRLGTTLRGVKRRI